MMYRISKLLAIGALVICAACSSDEVVDSYSEHGADYDKLMLAKSAELLDMELVNLGTADFPTLCHSMAKRIDGVDLDGNAVFVEAIIDIGELMFDGETADCYFEELMKLTFDKEYYCNVLISEGFGVWQWNQDIEDFEKIAEHESEIQFVFPSADGDDTDNAILSVSEIVFFNGAFPGKGDELTDGTIVNAALEALKLNIRINDKLVLSSNVLASFNDEGYYNDVAMTFNPQPYYLRCELAREDENAYWMFSFNRNEEVILSHDLVLGLNNKNTEDPVRSLANQLRIDDVVFNTEAANAELYAELLKVDELEKGTKNHAEAMVMALNNYATMDVRYVSNNAIIAKAEAVAKRTESDIDEWWVDLELEFSDASRMSSEVYFDDYLANFKVELEQLVAEFESKFGI
ncbi:hypothetical protein [Carboxylicivirga sp. M1479]|uniref:hypothetical protein n=1 Tax=Carboxylicivirga sp. M1479 TaxID=2594476 RepID=UPI0011779B0C|nr:hypothetical protein [Carboxylicivirga sp. M1479]TRX72304.1 hypothetical protein FNN09_02710 [Carboxylicivirga sp. M1479]